MSTSTYDGVPFTHDPYRAAQDRYRQFAYRQVGDSGLRLPPISLGLWYNFGDDRSALLLGVVELVDDGGGVLSHGPARGPGTRTARR
jgi:hypothetical protein